MKIVNIALIAFNLILILIIISSCSTLKKIIPKAVPEHKGVDVNLQGYVNEFKELALKRGIEFNQKVSIGIKDIEKGSIIGLCTYRPTFREVDIDRTFFNENSEIRRKALVFHELTHCYCTRGHDHSDGQEYPEASIINVIQSVASKIPWCLQKNSGYLDDGCPNTIMHPFMLSEICLETHWDEYMDEMFNRCRPW